jgi:hypothetical protein
MWCVPEIDKEFVRRMEDVLRLHARSHRVSEPVVCLDERPVHFTAATASAAGAVAFGGRPGPRRGASPNAARTAVRARATASVSIRVESWLAKSVTMVLMPMAATLQQKF